MKVLLLLMSIYMIMGCYYIIRDGDEKESTPINPTITEQKELYCKLSRPAYDKNGYVHSRCDGSGFTSLYSLGCPDVDLYIFDDNGKLYRSPNHDCFVNGKSNGAKAESSRDMYLMRMIAAHEHGDLDFMERMIEFGEESHWIMCDGVDKIAQTRCIMSYDLIKLSYAIRDKLRGESVALDENEAFTAIPLNTGYQAHLEVIKLWLKGRVYGAVTKYELNRLKRYAQREDKNALFNAIFHRYSDGDMSKAIELISRYPKSRLPRSSDWCTEYLWQRDQQSHSWKPCNENKQHSGTDFIFSWYVIKGG